MVAERDDTVPGVATSSPARDDTFVRSLDRGLAVIRAFGPDSPHLQLSEVARRTGLTRAAARRFLLTLVKLGYVRVDGREFSLRPRVLELGYAYLSAQTLPEIAMPHLEALVGRVSESSSVSVLDDEDVVYVARVPTRRIMTVVIAVGTRLPAYATSMGRVLLAGLPDDALTTLLSGIELHPLTERTIIDPDQLRRAIQQVRTDDFAIVDEELEPGLRSAAAPIRGRDGRVVAAVNVSVPSRTSVDELRRRIVPALISTAAAISHDVALS